ncbi:MAG: RDD family protein [Cruoricaptor ignavus]|nr:RDD family protein [Cruoricaptor ignavus]
MARISRTVELNQASKLKRLANYFIDGFFFYFLLMILAILSDDFENFLLEMENKSRIESSLIMMLLYFAFIFFLEIITKGRSLGKYITGTIAIKTDGTLLTTKDYLLRNACRLVPFDALSFLGTNGWHDSWSETRVVNKKSYENDKLSRSEINSIGT